MASRFDKRIELLATILLAVATVATAWSAFQSTKWSGVQTDSYSAAAATRTESGRASATANSQTVIDVTTFVAWASALSNQQGAATPNSSPYTPKAGTLSGFLFARFRPEFRPVVNAWLADRPLLNPRSPPTPFETPQYHLAKTTEADQLTATADQRTAEARTASQRADSYVLTTVLFAGVLFFAGVSAKLSVHRNRMIMITLAGATLLAAVSVVATLPITL